MRHEGIIGCGSGRAKQVSFTCSNAVRRIAGRRWRGCAIITIEGAQIGLDMIHVARVREWV